MPGPIAKVLYKHCMQHGLAVPAGVYGLNCLPLLCISICPCKSSGVRSHQVQLLGPCKDDW